MKISTGEAEQHETPLPLNSAGLPGVAPPTVREPGSDSPGNAASQVGGVYDGTAARESLLAASEADCRQAMSEGLADDTARRDFYEADIKPLGAQYGIGMTLPPGGMDPGVGSLGNGEALPFGAFYTPPRGGAPETYPTGSEPG